MSWFGSNSSHWDPGNWGSVGDVPIIGDIHKGLWGDPESIKSAYDKQIQASKDAAAQMQQFLLGQKSQAQGYYAPLQHMFGAAYGTEGIRGPQTPQASSAGVGPLSRMYGGG